MTGHPALLAAPPPLAGLPQEASIANAETSRAVVADGDAAVNLQASLTGATNPNGPTDLSRSPEDQATAQTLSEVQQTADAGSAEGAKKQYSDFLTQVTDIAFGPNHEKEKGPDFTAYGRRLVETNVLPPFAIADNTPAPIKLALNTCQDKAQYMLNHYRDGYNALKA